MYLNSIYLIHYFFYYIYYYFCCNFYLFIYSTFLTSKASTRWSPLEIFCTWMVVLNASSISISCSTSLRLVVPMISSLRPFRWKEEHQTCYAHNLTSAQYMDKWIRRQKKEWYTFTNAHKWPLYENIRIYVRWSLLQQNQQGLKNQVGESRSNRHVICFTTHEW